MSDHVILSIVLLAGKSGAPNFDFSFQQTACFRKTHVTLLIFCCFDQSHFVDLNSRTIKLTSISKLGKPYKNGKALDVSTTCRLVITDLIDGMSAKAVGKRYKLCTCHLPAGTSRSAIGRPVRDDLQMTYKRLTKPKVEKFTPQNIAYCQAFLDYMETAQSTR